MATTFKLPYEQHGDIAKWLADNLPREWSSAWMARYKCVASTLQCPENAAKNARAHAAIHAAFDHQTRTGIPANIPQSLWDQLRSDDRRVVVTIYDDADALAFKIMFGGETV